MYMDDIKLLAKNEKELETLIYAVSIYNQDIGMEFSIEKCAMLVANEIWQTEWNYQFKTRLERTEKRNLQILGQLDSWNHQTSGDERQN